MEDNWSEVDTSKKEENKVEFEVEKEPEKVEDPTHLDPTFNLTKI